LLNLRLNIQNSIYKEKNFLEEEIKVLYFNLKIFEEKERVKKDLLKEKFIIAFKDIYSGAWLEIKKELLEINLEFIKIKNKLKYLIEWKTAYKNDIKVLKRRKTRFILTSQRTIIKKKKNYLDIFYDKYNIDNKEKNKYLIARNIEEAKKIIKKLEIKKEKGEKIFFEGGESKERNKIKEEEFQKIKEELNITITRRGKSYKIKDMKEEDIYHLFFQKKKEII